MANVLAVLEEAAYTALSEEQKGLYTKSEKDEQYYLNMVPAEAEKLATSLIKERDRLKKHNETVLGEKDDLQTKLKEFVDLGKTPEEIKKFLAENRTEGITELEEKLKKQGEEHQKSIDSLKKSSEEEIQKAKGSSEKAMEQLAVTMVSNSISTLMRDFEMTPAGEDFLYRRIKAVKEEGKDEYTLRVVNPLTGEMEYKAQNLMTPKQLVEDTMNNESFLNLFKSGNGGGSGGDNFQGSAGVKQSGVVKADDAAGIGANLEGIAEGKIKVV